MEYNTQRDHLRLREYGRNVQRMAEYLTTVEDKEKRNSYAKSVVELMKQINPNVKDSQDYDQKVWDDLFIITEFKLDVDSPYEKPEASILTRKPQRMGYNSNEIKYRHFGRTIELLIDQAIALEDKEEQEGAVVTIGKLMKSFYMSWNKDFIEDEQVLKSIKELSNGNLNIDIEKVKEFKLFDMVGREREKDNPHRGGRGRNQGKGKRGNRRRRNN
jgi:hypothetical protein